MVMWPRTETPKIFQPRAWPRGRIIIIEGGCERRSESTNGATARLRATLPGSSRKGARAARFSAWGGFAARVGRFSSATCLVTNATS